MTDTNGEIHEAPVTAYVSGRPRLVTFRRRRWDARSGTFTVSWTAISVDPWRSAPATRSSIARPSREVADAGFDGDSDARGEVAPTG